MHRSQLIEGSSLYDFLWFSCGDLGQNVYHAYIENNVQLVSIFDLRGAFIAHIVETRAWLVKPCLAWCTARVRSHKRRPLLQWDWCALLTTVHCLTYFFTNAFSLVFRKTLGTPSSILTKRSRSRKNYLTFHTRNSNHCKRRTSYAVGWIYLILKQPFRNYKWKYKSAKSRWHRWKSWTTWDWKE